MKIHIIGGPGSGKTTLAKIFARQLECDVLHLDSIAYCNGDFGTPTDREYRLKEVSIFTKRERWVVEGVYFSWVGSSFKHCDKILFLSVDKYRRKLNILSKLSKRNHLTSKQFEQQKERLLQSNEEFDELFDKRIYGFLKKFQDKIVVKNITELEIEEFLADPRLGLT